MPLFQPAGGGNGILSYSQAQRDALINPSIGTVIFNSTVGRIQEYTSTYWRDVGDPLGINYIGNWNAESDSTSIWATYADAAQSTPVDGTGGSPNVTFSVSSTTPLRRTADFNLVKDAANRQGQGFSYDFTIDRADQGRVLQIGFDYEVVSGTYASGDMTVWVYDVTNAVLLSQPSGNSIISTSVPSQQGQCTFQTAINSTSYRLIFHVTTTSASAYTLAFDNISVGPQINASGSVDTTWTAYTPTFTGLGTVGSINVFYRRVGPDIEIHGTFQTGTPTATPAIISLPSGLSVNTSVITNSTLVGVLETDGTPGQTEVMHAIYLSAVSTSGFSITRRYGPNSNPSLAATNASSIISPSCIISFKVRIPIAGWSSNTVLSTNANTRRIAALITGDPASATSGNPIIVPTISFDDAAGYNATTGRYTCPVPGVYKMYGALSSASSATTLTIYKNGSIATLAGSLDSNGEATFCGSVLCSANDIIDIRPGGTVDATSMALNIELTQGPQQIAASEVVAFSANSSNTAATTGSPFVFTSETFDTHGSYSTSTGVFTAPAPGYYQFTAGMQTSSATVSIDLYKNGTRLYVGSQATSSVEGVVAGLISLVTGDTVDVRPSANATGSAANVANYFNGFRIAGIA